jgi:adenine-specific DNA methylase
MSDRFEDDLRMIEAGFPCHQVGAETQRERGASSALPPLYFLHVWWARRPLTPSRAAILASLLPADADTDQFLRDLGIEVVQVNVNGVWWTIDDVKLKRLEKDEHGQEWYRVDYWTLRWLEKEKKQRRKMREFLHQLQEDRLLREGDDLLEYWEQEFKPIPEPFPEKEELLPVRRVPGRPAEFNALMELAKSVGRRIPNLYGYDRAYKTPPSLSKDLVTVLDPTAGGGSIPLEGLRLGHHVIANELNPVAAVILKATLDYPARFGKELASQIEHFGQELLKRLETRLAAAFDTRQPLPEAEQKQLARHLEDYPDLIPDYRQEETTTYLFARQVTCPHCGGDAPLLNSCWLSKKTGDQWGVKIIPDGKERNGTVRFETYRAKRGKGPGGEDPDFSTVSRGVGQCIHCKQAISSDEIKRQARGESQFGEWEDRLFCVAAVRYQPRLDKNGEIYRYKSGQKEGQIRTEKVTFFRPPNERDLNALQRAEERLQEKWPEWEREGLIPTERFPEGNDMRPVIYGMPRWCDMFTPRQLLVHVTLVKELNRLKPQILKELGEERGKAVITYLQFAIDKGVDYNSRQTRWEYTRGVVKGTFGRHDFSVKWTFGEMIAKGSHSGLVWALDQILDAYEGISELVDPLHENLGEESPPVRILNRTAAYMPEVDNKSVDLVCIDPPYYNNVQYGELSDYFYVWEKRTLSDLYPDFFMRLLTNKRDEAVANPARDGGHQQSYEAYERMMGEVFAECQRVLKSDGLMTLMFTHKSQEAWEALTQSLIQNGWIISGCFPVESEGSYSIHQMDVAAAASAVFLSCRKRETSGREPTTWTGFGGSGVRHQVQQAVREGLKEFQKLDLNPVDEMVASYGRALRVLSQNWPVLDGDKQVSPLQAMNEASRVVAETQVSRITDGRLQVADLNPEAAMALTIYGIYGLAEFPYDDALNLSRSLRIRLDSVSGGYSQEGRMIGINKETRSTRRSSDSEDGYFAPLVRSGSSLRLAAPSERHPKRLENPQTEWDILHGLILAFREGDVPVARAYLQEHASGMKNKIMDLLRVWTAEMADEDLRQEGLAIEFGLTES